MNYFLSLLSFVFLLLQLQHHLQRFLGLSHNFKGCLDLFQGQGLGDGVFDVDLLVGDEVQGASRSAGAAP